MNGNASSSKSTMSSPTEHIDSSRPKTSRVSARCVSRAKVRKSTTSRKRFKAPKDKVSEAIQLMQGTEYLIPKSAFRKVVKEIMQGLSPTVKSISIQGINALQEATEHEMASWFNTANVFATLDHRPTIKPQDLQVAAMIHGVDKTKMGLHASRSQIDRLMSTAGYESIFSKVSGFFLLNSSNTF